MFKHVEGVVHKCYSLGSGYYYTKGDRLVLVESPVTFEVAEKQASDWAAEKLVDLYKQREVLNTTLLELGREVRQLEKIKKASV